jgi:hypothetical protein
MTSVNIAILVAIAATILNAADDFTVEIKNSIAKNGPDTFNNISPVLVDGKNRYKMVLSVKNGKVIIAMFGKVPYSLVNMNFDEREMVNNGNDIKYAGPYYLFEKDDGKVAGFRVLSSSEVAVVNNDEMIALNKMMR